MVLGGPKAPTDVIPLIVIPHAWPFGEQICIIDTNTLFYGPIALPFKFHHMENRAKTFGSHNNGDAVKKVVRDQLPSFWRHGNLGSEREHARFDQLRMGQVLFADT